MLYEVITYIPAYALGCAIFSDRPGAFIHHNRYVIHYRDGQGGICFRTTRTIHGDSNRITQVHIRCTSRCTMFLRSFQRIAVSDRRILVITAAIPSNG